MDTLSGRPTSAKKNNQKWVEANFEAKERARSLNSGQLPYSPALETSDHPLSRDWSAEKLPDILFYLNPPPSQYANQTVGWLVDEETGDVVRSEDGVRVKDFEVLPRFISIEVEGWMIEAWRRLDPRITYTDIMQRQRSDPLFGNGVGLKKLSKNALQNQCRRACRKVLNSWVEYGRRDEPHRTEVESIEELSYFNIVHNTVLHESSEFPGRLVKFCFQQRTADGLYHAMPLEVNVDNFAQTTVDIRYFQDASFPASANGNLMTSSMIAAWEMMLLLQERAKKHGKKHWSKLDKQCLPVTWFDRIKKEKRTAANPTYDGGCEICTWKGPEQEMLTQSSKAKHRSSTIPAKRSRRSFGSSSDEPLMKKRKRAQLSLASKTGKGSSVDLVTGESDGEDICDSNLGRNFSYQTPIRGRRQFSEGISIEDEDDTELEDYDADFAGTEDATTSEEHPHRYSSRDNMEIYRLSPLHSRICSAQAKYYSSTYHDDNAGYDSGNFDRSNATGQPTWENTAFTTGSMDVEDLSEHHLHPYRDAVTNPPGPSYGQFLPNSTYGESFSSNATQLPLIATTPYSCNMSNVSAVGRASATLQQALALNTQLDRYPFEMPQFFPGRMTLQGTMLTDVLSSPLRRTSDLNVGFGSTPNNYFATGGTGLNGDFSRRHSFAADSLDNELETPYSDNSGDLNHLGSHLEHTNRSFMEFNLNPPLSGTLPPPSISTATNGNFWNHLDNAPFKVFPFEKHDSSHFALENDEDDVLPVNEPRVQDEEDSPDYLNESYDLSTVFDEK